MDDQELLADDGFDREPEIPDSAGMSAAVTDSVSVGGETRTLTGPLSATAISPEWSGEPKRTLS